MELVEFWTMVGALTLAWGTSFLSSYHIENLFWKGLFGITASIAAIAIFVAAVLSFFTVAAG